MKGIRQPNKIEITEINSRGKKVVTKRYYLEVPHKSEELDGVPYSTGPLYRLGRRKAQPFDMLYMPNVEFTHGNLTENPLMSPMRP